MEGKNQEEGREKLGGCRVVEQTKKGRGAGEKAQLNIEETF